MKRPTKGQFQDFANELISGAYEAFDIDGADIQTIAVKYELLEEVVADESCGKNCNCEEFGFPILCYRKTY